MNYEALILLSAATWRAISAIREPVLQKIEARLVSGFPKWGDELYSVIVWLLAFVIGYGYATMAGPDGGDMLKALGWTNGYVEIGYAMTAGFIASGSAGLRVAEKMFSAKTANTLLSSAREEGSKGAWAGDDLHG